MKARWTTILGGTRTGGTTATAAVTATSSATTTTAGTGTTGGGTRSSGGSSSSSFRIRALATTVRRGAAAAVASRYFFPSDDEAHGQFGICFICSLIVLVQPSQLYTTIPNTPKTHTDDTTSASSPSSQPFLPLPCPLNEQCSPPAGAEDGAAANDDNEDDEDDRDDKPDLGLWYIHGKAYNLAGFMAQHPGIWIGFAFARMGRLGSPFKYPDSHQAGPTPWRWPAAATAPRSSRATTPSRTSPASYCPSSSSRPLASLGRLPRRGAAIPSTCRWAPTTRPRASAIPSGWVALLVELSRARRRPVQTRQHILFD